MEIVEYYKKRTDLPQDGIMHDLTLMVGKLYHQPISGMERVKEDSLPILTFLNTVQTCVEQLEKDPFPSQIVNNIWDDLKPLNGKECKGDFRVSRWYEATIVFGGLYFIFARRESPDKDLLIQLEITASYNKDVMPYFNYFKNNKVSDNLEDSLSEDDQKIINKVINELMEKTKGFTDSMKLTELERAISFEQKKEMPNYNLLRALSQYAEPLRKSNTKNELRQSETTPQKKEKEPTTIEIDLLMKTASELFPDIASKFFDLIGYLVYNKFGDCVQQFEARKKMYEERLANQKNSVSMFQLADGQIGNLAKIVQVLCELGIVVKKDGTPAKPVSEVGQQVGRVFGEDFKNWSQTLKAAFDQNNYLDIFVNMENAAKEYKRRKLLNKT